MCSEKGCGDAQIDRRGLLVSGAAALIGLTAYQVEAITQEKRSPPTRVLDDPAIEHSKIIFKGGQEEISGYLARPKSGGKYPGVLVIAGNRISEEYIPNTCAALAIAGFVGLAPNIYHPLPDDVSPDAAPEEMKKAFAGRSLDDLQIIQAGASYLKSADFVQGRGLGITGFCRGGRLAMLFAVRDEKIRAVVAFHPAPMRPEEVAQLKIPIQIHHGTSDDSVPHNNTLELEKALRKQSTPVEVFLYEKMNHGFLAYTRPFYDAEAAKLAWNRTVEFLTKQLK